MNIIARRLGLPALLAVLVLAFGPAPGFGRALDMKIAIDIGHSPGKAGATSSRGVPEYLFNKTVAVGLLQYLKQRGFPRAFIINPAGKDITLGERARAANAAGADVLLSIHHDSVQPEHLSTWQYNGSEQLYCDKYRGFSLFYSEQNGEPKSSLALARLLGDALRRGGLTPTLHHVPYFNKPNKRLVDSQRGIYRYDHLVVLKHTDMPAVLLECGVIVNRTEEQLLCTRQYQHRIITAVGEALRAFASRGAP